MLSCHEIEGNAVCVAYSSTGSSIFPEVTDYSIYLSRERALSKETVVNELRYIVTFLADLKSKRRLISSVDDDFIRVWRDAEYDRVKANPISRKSTRAIKRTVNAKLRRIYDFYWWFQKRKSRMSTIIGPSGQILSSGPANRTSSSWDARSRNRVSSSREIVPLCFRNAGAASKHRVAKVPTMSNIEEVREILGANKLGFIEQRNILMLAIAEETGLRRGAINSLRIAQFSEDLLLEMDESGLSVVPDLQKFSYEAVSKFSPSLCLLILNFVEQCLKPIYRQRGWPIAIGTDRLFVSERSGKPLDPSSLTRVFSGVFKKLGFDKGSSIHLVRHYFTNVEIVKETERRLKLGLDTSLISICEAVSLKLNHQDPQSIRAYVSSVISDLATEMEQGRAPVKI